MGVHTERFLIPYDKINGLRMELAWQTTQMQVLVDNPLEPTLGGYINMTVFTMIFLLGFIHNVLLYYSIPLLS